MAGFVEQFAAKNLDDLVNAVGEKKGAVVDRHRRFGVADIAAVDVGNSAHAQIIPARPAMTATAAPTAMAQSGLRDDSATKAAAPKVMTTASAPESAPRARR